MVQYAPPTSLTFRSTKTYTHSVGLSCAFRQWRAKDSHCRFIHGYALQVKITFQGPLDDRGWVQDFGGLKSIKKWLEDTFDHKLLVAEDDPSLEEIRALHLRAIADVIVIEAVGMEMFAELIFKHVHKHLHDTEANAEVVQVEVSEHEGNSAICMR